MPGVGSQARYFKAMLKDADHLDQMKRLRVSEADVAPLKSAYEVGEQAYDLTVRSRPGADTVPPQAALGRLKEEYARSN